MKWFALPLLLVGLNASAQIYTHLECVVKDPCKNRASIGACVGNTSIRINDRDTKTGRYFSHMVVGKQNTGRTERMNVMADFPVKLSNDRMIIQGSTEDGDTWVDVRYNRAREYFYGTLTLEEDFAYQIACKFHR